MIQWNLVYTALQINTQYMMSQKQLFGKNNYDISQVKTMKGSYNTNFYYVKTGQESIIFLDNDEIIQFEQIIQTKSSNKKQVEKPVYNIRTKMPTNLTKAQKKYQEKMLKNKQGKPKTQISVDQIPSQIYDSTFSECFNCIDKNQEILKLRNEKKMYSDQFNKSQQKNKQLTELYNKNTLFVKQLFAQKIQLQQRLLISQEQCNKLSSNKQIQKKNGQKLTNAQFIDEIITKQKDLYTKILQLEEQNKHLKSINNQKQGEIKKLQQMIQLTQAQNPQLVKNESMFKKKRTSTQESYIQSQQLNSSDQIQILE